MVEEEGFLMASAVRAVGWTARRWILAIRSSAWTSWEEGRWELFGAEDFSADQFPFDAG